MIYSEIFAKIGNQAYRNLDAFPSAPKRPSKPTSYEPEDYRFYADLLDKYNAEVKSFNEDKRQWHEVETQHRNQFRVDVEECYNTTNHPKRDNIWGIAMNMRNGEYFEILSDYDDLVALLD
jgi:hypothetical protein